MKNIICLQKLEDGDLYCQQLTKLGVKWAKDVKDGSIKDDADALWEDGGKITLDEIDAILDREV